MDIENFFLAKFYRQLCQIKYVKYDSGCRGVGRWALDIFCSNVQLLIVSVPAAQTELQSDFYSYF